MKFIALLVGAGLAVQISKFPTCPGKACIFPVHRAEFLTGARFDIRVEMHGDTSPDENFRVEIAKQGQEGQELHHFFNLSIPQTERWEFKHGLDIISQTKLRVGKETAFQRVLVASRIWRNVTFKEAGHYTAKVLYESDKEKTVEWIVHAASCQAKVKNIIFMIADGTTTSMISAARAMAKKNHDGKFDRLQLDNMNFIGHVMTSSLDSLMTDSSNSASAYFTGHKAAVASIGVYPDSNPNHADDPKVELLTELARRRSPERGGKMAIGIVTTADVTDATPAAMFSHTRFTLRNQRSLHHFLYGAENATIPVRADVLLGGGGSKFLVPSDYYSKFQSEFGYKLVTTATQLKSYHNDAPLLGIFHKEHMNVYVDRHLHPENMLGNKASPFNDGKDATDQPSLVEMTISALDLLKKRGKDSGFFAMIESASPDKQMHRMDYHRSLVDVIEFDQAVKAAVDWVRTNDNDTLIVATADHGHGFDVYGTVDTQVFETHPHDAIGMYWNAGWPDYEDSDGDGFPDSLNVRTVFAAATNNHPSVVENFQMNQTHPRKEYAVGYSPKEPIANHYLPNPNVKGIQLNANIPTSVGEPSHTLTDVPIFSQGPGAHKFAKVLDNTQLFFNFADLLALGEASPDQCLS